MPETNGYRAMATVTAYIGNVLFSLGIVHDLLTVQRYHFIQLSTGLRY